MERIVVVGCGIAGLTAAHALRDAGWAGQLTIIGDEDEATYSRPALSKAALLADELGGHELADPTHGARELRGRRAVGVRVAERVVVLDDGQTVPYDGLVLATGAGARRLTDSPHELALRTLVDARGVHARLAGTPSVVVVGSGPLGMELASGAVGRGCGVTAIGQGRPLERHLGPYLAEVLLAAATAHGVRLVSGRAVSAEAGPDGARVLLDTGEEVTADVLVSAVGDVPHDAWLADSGLLTDGRLVVDACGRVLRGDVPRGDIVAAGDVAWWPGPSGPQRTPLWTAAIDQGKVAARTLLAEGEPSPLDAVPYFWTEQFGRTLRVMGTLPAHSDPEVIRADPDSPRALLRWPPRDGRPGTAVAINERIPLPKLRRIALGQD